MQNTLSVIDLSAIRSNALYIRTLIGGRKLYAVVKADAYGHGACRVAAEIEDVADGFCVAIAQEGAQLRLGGVEKPVLVLAPPTDKEDAARLKFYNLTATVTDENSARLISGGRCHIAVNTGMNRYGCFGEELERVLDILPPCSIEGVYSHLYAPNDGKACFEQRVAFERAVERVSKVNENIVAHLSASGGTLLGGEYLFGGVRCGIMLYGYAPCGFKCKELKPALKVYAPLAQTTRVTGRGVGYSFADCEYTHLYTYRLGYADGFFRNVPLGEKTLCMDAFISREGRALYPVMTNAEEYAARCGTISYEVLCSVTKRSVRVYERRDKIQI